jgi:hypothetical protein
VTLLTWREAVTADRDALMRFSCTVLPPRERFVNMRKRYPKPWEREVEAYIRDFRPPGPPDQKFFIGEDEQGIGAAFAFVAVPPPDWLVKLQVVAVDNRYRGQGGAVADETMGMAMQTAFDTVASRGHEQVDVFGLVHVRNSASKWMCERHGFKWVGASPVEDDVYEQWSVTVTVDSARSATSL